MRSGRLARLSRSNSPHSPAESAIDGTLVDVDLVEEGIRVVTLTMTAGQWHNMAYIKQGHTSFNDRLWMDANGLELSLKFL